MIKNLKNADSLRTIHQNLFTKQCGEASYVNLVGKLLLMNIQRILTTRERLILGYLLGV